MCRRLPVSLHDEQPIARHGRRSQRFRNRGHRIATPKIIGSPAAEVLESRPRAQRTGRRRYRDRMSPDDRRYYRQLRSGRDSPSVTRGGADGQFVHAVGDRATGEACSSTLPAWSTT